MPQKTKGKPARKVARKASKAGKTTAAPATPSGSNVMSNKTSDFNNFEAALVVLGESQLSLFGRRLSDRIRQQFAREGLRRVLTLEEAREYRGPIVFVRADGVLDQPLIAGLIKRPNFLLLSSDADRPRVVAGNIRARDLALVEDAISRDSVPIVPGLLARAPGDLDVSFWKALRKKETPYALVATADNRSDVAWRMFMGTYKGATDIVTKHVWPVPAFHGTQYLSARGVTPNMVTTVAAFMTVAAFFLFLNGHFLPGLLAAWFMTFLDTVDGKLARTTLTSSKWGDVFDHGIDLVHPPFWYVAWALGLSAWGLQLGDTWFWWVTGLIISGYVLQRLMEGISIKWLGLEIHIWRKIDTLFRQVTARRNPNLILLSLSLLFARPDWGLVAVAAWTVICLVLHAFQLAQGVAAKKAAGGTLTSWMAK